MIEQYMWIIWLSLFALSLIIEALTFELVSVFFSIGAIAALIMSFISGVPYYAELIVFVLLSVISLFALRPLMKKVLKKQKRLTNVDEFVVKEVKLTKAYEQFGFGETTINGITWNVVNVNDKEPIEVCQEAIVVSISGNKLIVKIKE